MGKDRMMTPRTISPAILLAALLGLAACGGSAKPPARTAPAHSSKPAAASPALIADKAVCKQFTDESKTGQVLDETGIVALLGQYPAVSPALARDYQSMGNAITLHSNLITQIHVTADCAIVGVGRIPSTTWPPGS
jgi:hypothetical protein